MIERLRKSDLARHGAIVGGGVVVANVFNYLYYMLVGRTAGVVTYGVVTSLASALLIASAPATVVQFVAARLAADLEARRDLPAIRHLADVVSFWTGLVAAAGVIICILARQQVAQFFNLTDPAPVVVASLAAGLFALVIVQRGIFQGAHRFGDFSMSTVIDAVTKVIVGIPLIAFFGATGALFGIVVSLTFAAIYSFVAFHRRFGSSHARLALDRSLISRVASNVGVAQLTFTVLMFYDVPLIKHTFDARTAGLYAAAALVGRAVLAAISFVPTLVMPKATARVAEGRSPLPLLGAALGIAGIVVVCAALAGIVAPQFVVTLIAGRAFRDAAPFVLPYVIASGGLALANVVGAYKMGLHRYDFVIPLVVVAAAEICTFCLWHPTLLAAITVLVGGHVCILGVTLFGLNAPLSSPSPQRAVVADAEPIPRQTRRA